MKLSRTTIIITVVLLVHAIVFVIITHVPALPKAHYIPPPNFGTRTETYEDPKTGEKTIYQEFRVSTKLVPRQGPNPPSVTNDKIPAK